MVENLETYLNRRGYPMIRRCFNCKNWQVEEQLSTKGVQLGFCLLHKLHFAFTLKETVHPITRDFYLCEKHEFEKEEWLKSVSPKVSLKDSIKKKDEIE